MSAFAFGIPLRSQASAKDWSSTVHLFRNTVRSILRQTDPDFQVYVCCHEIPTISELTDPRVEVVEAHWIADQNFPMADKRNKHLAIAQAWGALGGGYLMFVNSDDLVSRNLVAQVRTQRQARGFFVQHGYELDTATGLIQRAPRFHRLCGSSIIVNWSDVELPRHDIPPIEDCLYRRVLDIGRARTVDFFADKGDPLTPLPFPAAVYVRNHGDNVSATLGTDRWRRKLQRRITPKHRPDDAIRLEFGLPWEGDDWTCIGAGLQVASAAALPASTLASAVLEPKGPANLV